MGAGSTQARCAPPGDLVPGERAGHLESISFLVAMSDLSRSVHCTRRAKAVGRSPAPEVRKTFRAARRRPTPEHRAARRAGQISAPGQSDPDRAGPRRDRSCVEGPGTRPGTEACRPACTGSRAGAPETRLEPRVTIHPRGIPGS